MADVSFTARRRAKRSAVRVDTRSRILDVAERIFADKGFSGTSLREIVGAAKVNVAAIHYHFGSKEALFEAVFVRSADPIRQLTLQMQDAAEEWAGRPEYLEQILRAVLVPTLREVPGISRSVGTYGRLRAHIFVEDRAFARRLFRTVYADAEVRAVNALRRAFPAMPRKELAWKFHTLLATMVFSTIPAGRVHTASFLDAYAPQNSVEAITYLVPLMAGLFRAQVG